MGLNTKLITVDFSIQLKNSDFRKICHIAKVVDKPPLYSIMDKLSQVFQY